VRSTPACIRDNKAQTPKRGRKRERDRGLRDAREMEECNRDAGQTSVPDFNFQRIARQNRIDGNPERPGTEKYPGVFFRLDRISVRKPRSRTQRAGERRNASQLGSRELTRANFIIGIAVFVTARINASSRARRRGFIFATSETRSLTSSPSSERQNVSSPPSLLRHRLVSRIKSCLSVFSVVYANAIIYGVLLSSRDVIHYRTLSSGTLSPKFHPERDSPWRFSVVLIPPCSPSSDKRGVRLSDTRYQDRY